MLDYGARMSDDAIPRIGAAASDLLTVAEVAGIMRVSKMTIYRLVKSGQLHAMRVGRSFRIPRTAVEAFLRDADQSNRDRTETGEDGP